MGLVIGFCVGDRIHVLEGGRGNSPFCGVTLASSTPWM